MPASIPACPSACLSNAALSILRSFWPAKPVNGEARDVSIGGAQVWLAKRLPRFKQADVFMVIEGMIFRARAEIAGVELERNREVKGGYYRHSLRWVVMEAHAKEALSKVVPTS